MVEGEKKRSIGPAEKKAGLNAGMRTQSWGELQSLSKILGNVGQKK
jgi:hypothetical protein